MSTHRALLVAALALSCSGARAPAVARSSRRELADCACLSPRRSPRLIVRLEDALAPELTGRELAVRIDGAPVALDAEHGVTLAGESARRVELVVRGVRAAEPIALRHELSVYAAADCTHSLVATVALDHAGTPGLSVTRSLECDPMGDVLGAVPPPAEPSLPPVGTARAVFEPWVLARIDEVARGREAVALVVGAARAQRDVLMLNALRDAETRMEIIERSMRDRLSALRGDDPAERDHALRVLGVFAERAAEAQRQARSAVARDCVCEIWGDGAERAARVQVLITHAAAGLRHYVVESAVYRVDGEVVLQRGAPGATGSEDWATQGLLTEGWHALDVEMRMRPPSDANGEIVGDLRSPAGTLTIGARESFEVRAPGPLRIRVVPFFLRGRGIGSIRYLNGPRISVEVSPTLAAPAP